MTLALHWGAIAATPDEPPPAVTVCGAEATNCQGTGNDGTFTGVGSGTYPGTSGAAGNTGLSGGKAPTVLPPTYEVLQYAPACSGNTRQRPDLLCGAAVDTCQPTGQGLVRYWRWVTTIDRATGVELGSVQSPGTYCLGPATAGLPPIAAIGGIVAADFQRLKVDVGKVTAEPGPKTLVNLETGFFTDADAPYVLPAVTILGHRVVVTAKPTTWEWFFGDGSRARTTTPGEAKSLKVSHTYEQTGRLAPYVVVTWAGTFTVDGGAPRDVFGTAQTTGPGTPLQVAEARAELVSG
jgi:hypothetical protein